LCPHNFSTDLVKSTSNISKLGISDLRHTVSPQISRYLSSRWIEELKQRIRKNEHPATSHRTTWSTSQVQISFFEDMLASLDAMNALSMSLQIVFAGKRTAIPTLTACAVQTSTPESSFGVGFLVVPSELCGARERASAFSPTTFVATFEYELSGFAVRPDGTHLEPILMTDRRWIENVRLRLAVVVCRAVDSRSDLCAWRITVPLHYVG